MKRFFSLYFTIFLATTTLQPVLALPPSAAMSATHSSTAFALISPAGAERFKSEAATPEAQRLLKLAEANLPNSPDPLSRVHSEGTLPHQGIRDQSELAEKDWVAMLAFATAYRLTGDSRYLDACDRFISAWLDVYQISFNPIDETNLDRMILAYDLTRAGLSRHTRDKMTGFLRTMAEGYLDKMAQEKEEDTANWQSHRVKLVTLAAYALGDAGLIRRARQIFQRQISVNIKPDGSVVDFSQRDALHYVVYDLEPLTVAALAAQAHGEDWFHASAPGGSSVERAIDWLTPFALGQKTHEEFVHSSVAFDAARAKAGLKEYAGLWEPASSIPLYQLAMLADAKYAPLVRQISSNSGRPTQDWLSLLAHAGF